jgi:hypothetical protein
LHHGPYTRAVGLLRSVFLALGVCVAAVSAAAGGIAEYVSLSPTVEALTVRVVETSGTRTVLEYTVGGYERTAVLIGGKTYYAIGLGEEATLLEAGSPELPTVGRSIIIPDNAEMAVRVLESSWVEYGGVPVAPSKGNLPRTVDPSSVPYEFGRVYADGGVYPADAAYGGEAYIMRDYRGMVVMVNPFQYDAGREVLRVCSRMVVSVEGVGVGKANVLTHRPERLNGEFDRMYREQFLNYESARLRYTPVDEAGGMLVICYGDFMTAMGPFVEWKRQMGMPCELVSVATAGGTSTAIKAYIQNYYNTHDLAYVLLVGDTAQCPIFMVNGGASDPSYSLLSGSDNRPEIMVGRFSAENVAQVETQVLRAVEYEKAPQAAAAWYHKGTGIASNQGPGDDGEYDYEHIDIIRDDLLGFTYTEVDTLYGITPTAAMVTTALNDGRSVINYCGHGSTNAWSTTGFSSTHVNALQNDNALPFIVSVACLNGRFDYGPSACFAENWLRATRGAEPIGAVATYMSSINQAWSPPMDAQDEFIDLLAGTSAFGVNRTFGGLCFNGSNHMMDQYLGAGELEFLNWNVFGDPSVRVRTDSPAALTVDHEDAVAADAVGFAVAAGGVEGALCALYAGGVLYGSGVTDAAGAAIIPLSPPLPAELDLTLTVTAFNSVPYTGTVHVGAVQVPVLSLAPDQLDASMGPDATFVDTLVLTNIGEPLSTLSFAIEIGDRHASRRVETCRLSVDPPAYEPGTTADYTLTIVNDGDGDAWVDGVTILLPEGVTAQSCTGFSTDARSLACDGPGGDVSWTGDWWNVVYPGDTARATVRLAVDPTFAGSLEIVHSFSMLDRSGGRQTVSGAASLAAPAGPTLTLTSPNGGEAWAADAAHDITWVSTDAGDSVALLWSSDGGATWETIAAATPNDGTYAWTCGRRAVSGNCLVRVTGIGSEARDTCDRAFTILEPVAWLTATPALGSIPAGTEQPVEVAFSTAGLPDGDYYADLSITSSGGSAVVPVSLHVRSTGVDDRYPGSAVLYGCYPNPFNPETRIAFSVPARQRVRLAIYDVTGRLVRELADRVFAPGNQFVVWNGRSDSGAAAASGAYFCRFEAEGSAAATKLLLLK